MPRRLQQLAGVRDDLGGDVVFGAALQGAPPSFDLLGPGILLTRREAEGLGHVSHGILGPVLDDVRDLRGAVPSIGRVDPLDDLFAPVGVEIDVDVGLLVAQARQEPLEGQVVGDRVDGGDVEQVADGAVGRRSPSLAQDAAPPGLLHDAVHDEEVAGEVLHLYDAEFPFDAVAVFRG